MRSLRGIKVRREKGTTSTAKGGNIPTPGPHFQKKKKKRVYAHERENVTYWIFPWGRFLFFVLWRCTPIREVFTGTDIQDDTNITPDNSLVQWIRPVFCFTGHQKPSNTFGSMLCRTEFVSKWGKPFIAEKGITFALHRTWCKPCCYYVQTFFCHMCMDFFALSLWHHHIAFNSHPPPPLPPIIQCRSWKTTWPGPLSSPNPCPWWGIDLCYSVS
jgi:hypothetical protein